MYDEYVEKIKKISKVKNKIYKFRFLILSVLAVIIASVVTLLSIKGNTSELLLPESITYGENYEASCSALMSTITGYEHKLEGTDTWEKGLPDKPGEYYVRAVAERAFGSGYSEEKKISIAKRKLNLTLSTKTITYGDYPLVISDNLAQTDKITNYVFTFDDLTKSKTMIDISLADIDIKNNNNESVTSCYDITYEKTEISFNKKNIDITPTGANKIYDGTPLELPNTYTVSVNPGYDDQITVSSYEVTDLNNNVMESVINPGKYLLKITSYDITSTGGSTLGNYNAKLITTPLIVEKRDIKINTSSSEYTYDGSSHKNDEFTLAEGYTLGVNDKLLLDTNNTVITHYGEASNIMSVKVFDKDDNDITSFYNISYNYGKLKVLKKDLTINISSLDVIYDGLYHSNPDYEEVGLVDGDIITSISGLTERRNAGEYINSFTVNIDNIDDYNVIYNNGSIKINKKDIAIKPVNLEVIYGDSIIYNESEYIDLNNSLCDSDNNTAIKVYVSYYQSNVNVTPHDVGLYDIKIESYESDNYNVTFDETGTLTINKYNLSISLKEMDDVIYDGANHIYYDEANNYIGLYDLPYEDELKVLVKYNDSLDLPNNVNTYDITYYDYEIINGSKDNYIISCNNSVTFNIQKKNIYITPLEFTDKIYDGIEYEYEIKDNNFIGIEYLCNNDKVKITVKYTIDGVAIDKVINAGSYVIEVDTYEFTEGLESNYNVNLLTSEFKIFARAITLKPNNIADKIYDGIEVIYDNRTPIVVEGNFVFDEKIEIVSVSIIGDNLDTRAINATTYHYNITEVEGVSGTILTNYNISYVENTFTINPMYVKLNLVCDILGYTKEYDGTYYYFSYTHTPIVEGEDLIPEIIYLGRDHGYTEILNADTYDVSLGEVTPFNTLLSNYDIHKDDKEVFTVTPKHIEITPNNFENKVYDGLSYVYDIVENNFYEKSDLISGDGITIEAEIIYLNEVKIVTITNDVVITETEIEEQVVSEAKNAGSYKIRVRNYEFTSGIETNYVVDKTNEVSFEISKRDVKILLNKALDSKVYDGYKYEYSYTVDNIVSGEEIEAEIAYLGQSYNETEILYVDTYDVYVKQIKNNIYLKNYTVDTTDTHIFTVTQKPVTIRPIDMPDLIYGEAITYNPNSYVFVSGELTSIDDSTAISINVGYFKNNIEVTPKNANLYEIRILSHESRNYDVSYDVAVLRINPYELNINLKSLTTVTYDGLTHQYEGGYDNYIGVYDLPYNEKISILVTYNDTTDLPKNAGTYIIKYDDYQLQGESKDNYIVSCGNQITFIINQRPIKLSPLTINNKEYNGIGITYYSEIGSYDFAITEGTMVDGEFFTIDDIIICLLNGMKLTQAVDATTYIVKIEDLTHVIEGNANTLKANYSITFGTTQFTITPRSLKFTLSSSIYEKVYDGETYSSFTATPDRLVGSEMITADIVYKMTTPSFNDAVIRNAGTYKVSMNVPNDSSHYTNGAKATNYNVDFTETKDFVVTKAALDLAFTHPNNDSKVYDGEPIASSVYENFTITGLVATYDKLTISSLFNGSSTVPKNVGSYTITFDVAHATVTPSQENPDYITRIENYNITTNSITYSITKRDIKFVLVYTELTRVYDGTTTTFTYDLDLTSPYYNIVSGESITPTIKYQSRNYSVDKTLRNVGVYDVSMTVTQSNCGENTLLTNYNVDYSDTKVHEITKKNLNVSYSYTSLDQKYNNSPIAISVSITDNASADTITPNVIYKLGDITYTTKPKDAGEYDIHINGYNISAGSVTTRMENYDYVTPADITYTVNKRTLVYNLINILGPNSTVYDGELHNDYFSVELGACDGKAPGEEAISASVVYKGQAFEDTYLRNKDIYDVDINVDYKTFDPDNYITILDSKVFTITPKPLNVTFGLDKSKIYDGEVIPIADLDLSLSGKVTKDIIIPTFSFNDSATNPKDAGVYTVKATEFLISIDSSQSGYKTRMENYSVSNVDELIYTIEKKSIEIAPRSVGTMYDGEAHTYKDLNQNYIYVLNIADSNPMPSGENFRITDAKIKLNDTVYDSVTNANTYYVYVIDDYIEPINSNTKKSNYDITISETAEFRIDKRSIKYNLISKDEDGNNIQSKEYDGEAYYFTYEIDSSSDGFVQGENIIPIIKYLGDNTGNNVILEIDEYNVSFEQDLTLYEYDNALIDNYDIDNSAQKTFMVVANQITIGLIENQSKIYDGVGLVYDSKKYEASKDKELLDQLGFGVVVNYFSDNSGANPISEIKNAGTYYIQIDEAATRNIINSIPELNNNFVFAINDTYYEYNVEKLWVHLKPTHYVEAGIDKFSDKIYDRLAYSGYDSTKYEATVDESQEGHSIPEGEGFILEVAIIDSSNIGSGIGFSIPLSNVIYAKNAYQYSIVPTGVTENANTSLDNYSISFADYKFEISPVNVTLTPSGMIDGVLYYVDKEYDGDTYIKYNQNRDTLNIEFEIDNSYFDGITFGYNMSIRDEEDFIDDEIKNANKYQIVINGATLEGDESDNYIITKNTYDFEITKRPVSIELITNSTSKVYDGLEYLFDGSYQVTSDKTFLNNATLYIGLTGNRISGDTPITNKIIYAGKYEISYDAKSSSMSGDLLSNYEITQTNKVEFEITKRSISIKTGTNSLEYNGMAQYDASYEVTSELGMADGDTLVPTTAVTATDVNNGIKNEVAYTIHYADGHTSEINTGSYSIVVQYGRLTIVKKKITLTSKTDTLIYDGTKQILAAFEDESGICSTDKIVFKESTIKQVSGLTYVGTIDNVLQKKDSNNNVIRYYTINNKFTNKDVTNNYDITYYQGKLTIAPREVTIIGYNKVSKEYSAKTPSITKSSIKYAPGSLEFISADNPTITVKNAPIDVGVGTYQLTLTMKSHANCYIINQPTTSEIEIEITPRKITLETASNSWEYDGVAHSDLTYTDLKRLINGHTITAISSTQIKNVGSVDNVIEFRIFDSNNNDITSNYNIVEKYGVLEIVEGIAINVKISDLEYTGNEANITIDNVSLYSPDGYDTSIYTLLSLTINTVNGAVNVGSGYTANIDYSYKNNNSGIVFNKSDVDVSFNIIKRSIMITINTLDRVYTGERYAIGPSDYQITSGSLLPGDVLSIVGDKDAYYGTSVKVGMASYTVMNGSTDVTGNYNVEAKKGKICIPKISINITTGSKKFNYDLQSHEFESYTIDNQTLEAYGLHAEVATKASITNCGKVTNKITFNILDSQNRTSFTDSDGYLCDYSKIFSYNTNYGDLTVNQVDLTVGQTESLIEYTFNGQNIQCDSSVLYARIGETDITSQVILDVEFQSFYYPMVDHVDNNFVVNHVYDLNNNDITKNFSKIKTTVGKIMINRATIKIETLGNEKMYDGNPLKTSGVTVNDTQMIQTGDKFELVYGSFRISLIDSSSITNVGETHDVYTNLVILDSEDNDVTNYFMVTGSTGKLLVTQVA